MATSNAVDLLREAIDGLDLSIGGAPTEFHQFPNLPLELRIKIYKVMAPTHRVIRVEVVNGIIVGSYAPVPIPLHLNHEARREIKKMYHCLVPDGTTPPTRARVRPPPIYFHPATDTIQFHGHYAIQYGFFSLTGLPLIKNPAARLELANITAIRLDNVEFNIDFLFWILQFPNPPLSKRGLGGMAAFTSLKKIEIYMTKLILDASGQATPHPVGPEVEHSHLAFPMPPIRAQIPPAMYKTRPRVPRQLLQIPGGLCTWMNRRTLRRLFTVFYLTVSPKTYDATNKPYLDILTHDGTPVTRFWDKSYGMDNIEDYEGGYYGDGDDSEDEFTPGEVIDLFP